MSRWEFMSRLEKLLLYVPIQEREEALQYYNDYFEDAGPENEQEVIASLGSPEKVAENIKRDIHQSNYGAEPDRVEQGKEMVEYHPQPEIIEEPMKNMPKSNMPGWLKIVILVCAAPILIGIFSGLFGAAMGIIGGIIGVLFAGLVSFGVIGIVCPIVGIILVIAGIGISLANVLAGLCVIGVGLLCMALGVAGICLEVLLLGKWAPSLIKAIAKGVRKVFQKLMRRK